MVDKTGTEEPVLGSEFGGADSVLYKVIIKLVSTIIRLNSILIYYRSRSHIYYEYDTSFKYY